MPTVAMAGVEARRAPAARRTIRAPAALWLSDLIAMRMVPALVGGVVTMLHTHDPGAGALVLAAMLVAPRLLGSSRFPLELMPAARVGLALLAPAAGAATALAVSAAARGTLSAGELASPLICAWLVLALGAWVRTQAAEGLQIRVGVLGSAGLAEDLAAEMAAAGVRGYDVVGWIGARAVGSERLMHLGTLDTVRQAVLDHGVHLLVSAPRNGSHDHAALGPNVDERVADACLDLPVRMTDANQLYEDLLGHVPLGTTDAAWFRYIMHPRFRATSPASKRVFDLAGVLALGLIAAPALAVAAVAIKLTDGGPVFYRQRRLGERGRAFSLLKLRTMVPEAEPDGLPVWSEADDGRVTWIGRILRRTHLDELPQLWNILRGEMTLVGPRPERPQIVAELERQFPYYARRHLVKPGIAGWAQLRCGYAGTELGSAWKLCHDLFYIKHRSILGDALILLETAAEVSRDAHRALPAPLPRFIVREDVGG